MKLIQKIKQHLPVSRKTHEATLNKAHQQHEMDAAYLTGQLRQVTAHNMRLERVLAADHEGSEE